MRIGVPKEIMHEEDRVAATPDSVRKYVAAGHEVFVEHNAGKGILATDADYAAAGAKVLETAQEVYDAAELILKGQVDKIISRLREQKNIRIRIEDFAYEGLKEAAIFDLSNGGRGIGNQVESLLINPLSRWLFDNEISGDADIVIEGFNTSANPPSVICRREETGK